MPIELVDMEVSIQDGAEVRVVGDVVDCMSTGNEYELMLGDGETKHIEGTIIGVASFWEINDYHEPTYDEVAIKMQTDGRLNVPIRPIATECSIDDSDWEYESGFEFHPSEVDPDDGACILRNVDGIAHEHATVASESDKDSKFKLHEGEGGFDADSLLDTEGPYTATFGSGWTSAPLHGRIERVTAYKENESNRYKLSPTQETVERVDWAFDETTVKNF